MKNSAKKSSSVKKVLKKIKPYSFYLILALVSAIISVSLTLYIPVLTGNAIGNIIDKGNVDFASVIQILVYIGVGIGGGTFPVDYDLLYQHRQLPHCS